MWIKSNVVLEEDVKKDLKKESERKYWEGYCSALRIYGKRIDTVKTSFGAVDIYKIRNSLDIAPVDLEKIDPEKWGDIHFKFTLRNPESIEEAKIFLETL